MSACPHNRVAPPLLAALLLLLLASVSHSADPTCARGVKKGNVCCSAACAACGGSDCGRDGMGDSCCLSKIRNAGKSCFTFDPPCVIAPPGTPSPKPSDPPSDADPTCSTGIRSGSACCPASCIICGGSGCGSRGPNGNCCSGVIRDRGDSCNAYKPPCVIGAPVVSKSPQPSKQPSPSPVSGRDFSDGTWRILDGLTSAAIKRHEACFVMYKGKGYLLGGRGDRLTSIFDPAERKWTTGPAPPIWLHHMQCVAWRNRIWIVSAWTGRFPTEDNAPRVYAYHVNKNEWITRRGLPSARRRGGAAAVLYGDGVFVVGGNRGGHGAHSTTLGWMDYYHFRTNSWTTNLPTMADFRDHTGGAVVKGNMLCIAGGRHGNYSWANTKTRVDTYCYDLTNGVTGGSWKNMNAKLPAGRAGAATGTLCDGNMMVVGGEEVDAFARTDVFDGVRWKTTGNLEQKRHGIGLAVSDCSCGKVYVAAGARTRGGSQEITSTEEFTPGGNPYTCTKY